MAYLVCRCRAHQLNYRVWMSGRDTCSLCSQWGRRKCILQKQRRRSANSKMMSSADKQAEHLV
jgi:hypothetical protein